MAGKRIIDEEQKEEKRQRIAIVAGPLIFVVAMYFMFVHDYGEAEKRYIEKLDRNQKRLAEIAKGRSR